MSRKMFALSISSLSEDGGRGAVIVNGKTFFNKVVTREIIKEKDIAIYVNAALKSIIKIHGIKNTITGESVLGEYMTVVPEANSEIEKARLVEEERLKEDARLKEQDRLKSEEINKMREETEARVKAKIKAKEEAEAKTKLAEEVKLPVVKMKMKSILEEV